MGGLNTAPQTPTAPATVCGERPSEVPLTPVWVGKAEGGFDPRVRRLAMQRNDAAVGCDGKER